MKHVAYLFLVACVPDAPETPSFQQDVLPILAANCVRCHGYPALGGAPASLRLDSYGPVAIDDTRTISGAGLTGALIAARVAADDRPMPPRFRIEAYQIETLRNWVGDTPSGEAPPRGEPRPNNRAPSISIERTEQVGTTLTLVVRVEDSDGDLVAGVLQARVGVDRVVGPVRNGLLEIAWDVLAIAPGEYPIEARVDDGAEVHVIGLGTIRVGGP
jgi:hypothetical protein